MCRGLTLGSSKSPHNGALTFKAQPDFETPGDSNGDNVYEVTVVASDPAKNSDELDVRVTVTNVEETWDDSLLIASAEGWRRVDGDAYRR